MVAHSKEPVQSLLLESLCLAERLRGGQKILNRKPAAFALQQGKEDWEVTPVGRLNNRMNCSFAVTQRNEATGTEKMTSVSGTDLISAVVHRDCSRILQNADAAARKEQEGRERLCRFDVPRSGRIVVLQIITADGNPTMSASLLHTYLFMRLLRQRNPLTEHRIILTGIPQLDVPLALSAIKRDAHARREKPPYCIQDYNAHGDEDSLCFQSPLTPEQIWAMQLKYGGPGHTQTMACYKGGLGKADAIGPLTSFTHTDGRSWNCLAIRKDLPSNPCFADIRGSPGMLFLLKELARDTKRTFGEAVAAADEDTKRIARLNPGATINGVQTE